ncbi:hypothetical protein E0H64_13965 [Rhizobium leguminosarum bv. viciae]|uniref:hypothetical protein n=1 Tax=Rhizobium leguminosarum TaxID=384 RepID=UPI0010391C36|nr:hypothetical protein [Rhizobium leguminosarum]MBY2967489.1 hypothetical protein [Rhizobium leguminosarum]TBZ68438.1 hypothetical protein E0H64_13965 [Rhizobium leguminosarum bv. viciae]
MNLVASHVFIFGCLGAVCLEILHWWGLRFNSNLPAYAFRPFYWIVTLAFIVIGGLVAVVQLGQSAEPVVAFQIGVAAPHILQKLAANTMHKTGSQGAAPSLADFLRG